MADTHVRGVAGESSAPCAFSPDVQFARLGLCAAALSLWRRLDDSEVRGEDQLIHALTEFDFAAVEYMRAVATVGAGAIGIPPGGAAGATIA